MNLKKFYYFLKTYYKDLYFSRNSKIKLFNFQTHSPNNYQSDIDAQLRDHWLYRFIESRKYLDYKNRTIAVFGVNGSEHSGNQYAIKFNRCDYKLFYTIENVHEVQSPWKVYDDLLLKNNRINLSLGFDFIDHSKYVRFPFWIMTTFKPEDDYKTIRNKCENLSTHKIDLALRSRFCSFISRVDYFGDRLYFYDQVNSVGHVDCDGKFLHNNDDLWSIYKDDKREFLRLYKFNLCPENTNYKGYVTEKLFDAIYSGCVPIYWGSENKPEPDILNHSAIFFLNRNAENSAVLKELEELNRNPKLYKLFAEQNRLSKNAPEIIYNFFDRLDKKLKEIIK